MVATTVLVLRVGLESTVKWMLMNALVDRVCSVTAATHQETMSVSVILDGGVRIVILISTSVWKMTLVCLGPAPTSLVTMCVNVKKVGIARTVTAMLMNALSTLTLV
jgi:hypothetical protein